MSRLPFTSVAELEANCAAIGAMSAGVSGEAKAEEAIESATELMWHLTGRQFGVQTTTIRPHLDGENGVTEVDLGKYPVTSILSVKVDGATLPVSAYFLKDSRTLQRVDGAFWPSTQKLHLNDTETETWSITMTWGSEPPPAVRSGTRRLACELLALSLDRPSILSDRVRSVTRQGMSLELVSPEDLLTQPNGRTGIYEVDLAISAYNAGGNAAMPAVLSPDLGWSTGSGARSSGFGSTSEGPKGDKGDKGDRGEPGISGAVVLQEETLSVSASTITISAMGQHRRWLLSIATRSTGASTSPIEVRTQFNDDTSNNYEWVQDGGSNSGNTYAALNAASNTSTYIRLGYAGSASASGEYSMIETEVVAFPALGHYVYLNGHCVVSAPLGFEMWVLNNGGLWRGAGSPTTMTLSLAQGAFAAGTYYRVEVWP